MNIHVSFNVYGTSLGSLQQQAIAELARFSDSDFQWSISIDVTSTVVTGDGTIQHWKAEVSAHPKHSTGHWQDAS